MGAPAAYSNLPNRSDGGVNVRAPGGEGASIFACESDLDVWSTIWPGSGLEACGSTHGYETDAGTSMSTPHVSGLAAILSARGLTNGQILDCIQKHSSNGGSYDQTSGYGIVDADAATASCTSGNTPNYVPPAGGSGGGGGNGASRTHVSVQVMSTTRKALARTGRLKVVVSSDRPVTVKLRAIMGRGRHAKTVARGRVKLTKAGHRKGKLELSRKARRKLAHGSKSRLVVRYSAPGGVSGTATRG
jgi:hypothetical protein